MKKKTGITEPVRALAAAGASTVMAAAIVEHVRAPTFTYGVECVGPLEEYRARYVELRDFINAPAKRRRWWRLFDRVDDAKARMSAAIELALIPQEIKWADSFPNTVCDLGANDLLDKYFAGSAYTAAFYVGLISSTSYTAIAAANTMASHAGWLEAGVANAPTYSQANRPALNMASAASARAKATSAVSAFSITGTGTVKGAFITTNNTKDGTTGILYSAGLFSGGDRAVISGDTVNVSGSFSA